MVKEDLYFDGSEYKGFAATVKVKDTEIYVDTQTGTGYTEVLKELHSMIDYLAGRFTFDGFTLDDNKQHIAVMVLEGIPKFDPTQESKLSSFLQMRIGRRLINELRDRNKPRKSATTLKHQPFTYRCSCGNSDFATLDQPCRCGLNIVRHNVHWIRQATLQLDNMDGYCSAPVNTSLGELELKRALEHEKPIVQDIVYRMYFDDSSIKSIAEDLHMTPQNIYLKIKGLRRNHKLYEAIRSKCYA